MFSPLGTIPTVKQDINLSRNENGDLLVQQNQLTVALGYNKFISLSKKKGSGLGKFLSVNGAVVKYKGKNWLYLSKLVNGILPAFIKDYRRNLFNQPTRQKYVTFDVDDFIRNAKSVLQTLKEWFEMYSGMDSTSKEKGDLGELLVERYFKSQGFDVEKYPNAYKRGASRVDFLVTQRDGKQFFVEAKAQKALHFGKRTYTYSFPCTLMDAYVSYSKKTQLPVYLAVTDAIDAKIYIGDINSLHKETKCDGYFFPREYFSEELDADCTYFNQKQFSVQIDIEPCAELTRLAELFSKKNADEATDIDDDSTDQSFDETETQDEPASLNSADLPIESTPPEEQQPPQPVAMYNTWTLINVIKVQKQKVRCYRVNDRILLTLADVYKSLGYSQVSPRVRRGLFARLKEAGAIFKSPEDFYHTDLRVLVEQLQIAVERPEYIYMQPRYRANIAPVLHDLKVYYGEIMSKFNGEQSSSNTAPNLQDESNVVAALKKELDEYKAALDAYKIKLDERAKALDEREKNLDEREAAHDEVYEITCDMALNFRRFEEAHRNCKKNIGN